MGCVRLYRGMDICPNWEVWDIGICVMSCESVMDDSTKKEGVNGKWARNPESLWLNG